LKFLGKARSLGTSTEGKIYSRQIFDSARLNICSRRGAFVAKSQLFPVTVVGSWPRPQWLIQALRKRQAGEISFDEFNTTADDAVLAAIKYQEDANVDIVTDG